MSKSIIYYTDNRLDEPIFSICQRFIRESGLPIVSTSLKPIDFGKNIVVEEIVPGYRTMAKQILVALENSVEDYVFFCEHDVLYHKSHFDFTPPKDDVFYYNHNVWRWDYPRDRIITYEKLHCLSGLCVNRKFALDHYRMRVRIIEEGNYDEHQIRVRGYEPGTKNLMHHGFSDDTQEAWYSEVPDIDIRHNKTYSIRKVTLGAFTHLPTKWRVETLDKIPGWNLKELFK